MMSGPWPPQTPPGSSAIGSAPACSSRVCGSGARLAAEPDLAGLADVRLQTVVPQEMQYAAYRLVLHLMAEPRGTSVLFGHGS